MTLEEALRISTTLVELDKLMARLHEELRDAASSETQLMMAANARQSLNVLTDSLRALGPPEDG